MTDALPDSTGVVEYCVLVLTLADAEAGCEPDDVVETEAEVDADVISDKDALTDPEAQPLPLGRLVSV